MELVDGRIYFLEYDNDIVFGVECGNSHPTTSESHSIWSFNKMESAEDFGVRIEMGWTYWFTEVMRSIIPYYSVVNALFLQSFLASFADQVNTLFYGPNRLSRSFASRFQAMAALRIAQNNCWSYTD
jgi:hypothetical protein